MAKTFLNSAQMVVTATMSPQTTDSAALGTASLMWSDLFLASGSVLNFNAGDVTLTHSSNALTVAGGTFATAALTTSTIVASGIIKTDDSTNATSTTDGSLQTDGGLSVALDTVIGDDLFLLSDSAVLSMGAGSDITFSHDGTTGLTIAATPISVNSIGNMTLDSTTDIILDAAGNDVIFKTAGTESARLTMDSTTSFELAAAGDIILDPAGNNVLPGSDSADSLGSTTGTTTIDSSFASYVATNGTDYSSTTTFVRFVNAAGSSLGDALADDTISLNDGSNTWTATLAGAPSTTLTIASSFGSYLASTTLTSSTSAISPYGGGWPVALMQVISGDAVVIGTWVGTVSSTPSSTSGTMGVSYSSGADQVPNGGLTTTVIGDAVAVTSASGTLDVSAMNGGQTVSITRPSSAVAWANLYVDNIDLNAQGSISIGGTGRIDLDADDDTSIRASADDVITFEAGGSDEMSMSTTSLYPATDDGLGLGSANQNWSDLFLADGAVLSFGDDQDITFTHNGSTTVTVAGGTLATAALTTSTIVASGIIKTDDSTAATSTTDGSLQTDGGLSVVLDAVIGDDLMMLSDSAVVHFGADKDVTLTHVADTGLTLGGAHANGTNLQITNSASDGDAAIQFALGGTVAYTMGVEDGDGDKFVINYGTGALGAQPAIEISSSGAVTIPGNLTVTGTTTTVDTVTMNAANAIIFEGATADNYETTLTIVDPANDDNTVYIPDATGYLPLLADASDTDGAVLAAEFALLDGGSSVATVTVADGDGVLFNDAGSMKQITVQSLAAYFDDEITSMPNLTTAASLVSVATIGTGVWQGTKVASAYLDDDTAHLSTTQTFSGAKTFSAAAAITDSTAASSATTGALKVTGGISTQADLYVGDDLALASDGAVLSFGDSAPTSLTHIASNDAIRLNSSKKLEFADAGTFIHQSADGVLTIESDTTVDINGAVVFDGALSGATTVAMGGALSGATSIDGSGDLTMGTITMPGFAVDADGDTNLKSLRVDDDSYIGSDSVTDLIQLQADGDIIIKDGAYDFDIASHDGTNGLLLGGVTVTASAAELNYVDIATLGTAATSKALTIKGDSTWTVAGMTCADIGTVTTMDLNGGSVDGATIGAASHTTGKFTTVDATTDFTIDGLVLTADTITNDAVLTVVSTGLTFNASLDIALSADGGNVTMDDGTTTVFDFNTDDPELKIMDDAQVANYLSMAVGANGATTIQTVDADAAAANLTITADGTFEAIGTTITLDSGGNIALEPASGSHIKLDDVIQVDSGVVTGATSITSTAFVGGISGGTLVGTSLALASGATVTGVEDSDTMSSDSATLLATQQSIKAYVDAQLGDSDLDFVTDTGSGGAVDLDSQALSVLGGAGVGVTHSSQTITVAMNTHRETVFMADNNADSNSIDMESGDVKGIFAAAEDIVSGSLRVYLNGMLQRSGAGYDYVHTAKSGGTEGFVTMSSAIDSDDVVICHYVVN